MLIFRHSYMNFIAFLILLFILCCLVFFRFVLRIEFLYILKKILQSTLLFCFLCIQTILKYFSYSLHGYPTLLFQSHLFLCLSNTFLLFFILIPVFNCELLILYVLNCLIFMGMDIWSCFGWPFCCFRSIPILHCFLFLCVLLCFQDFLNSRLCYNINYYDINTFKYHVFAPMGIFQLELIYFYFPPSFHLTVGCFCPVGLSLF